MSTFQAMPPELMRHLLKDEEDAITPAMEQRISEIKRAPCPRCGAALQPKLHDQPFGASDPLPRFVASCECGFTQDPQSGLVHNLGSAAKVQDPLPIIKVKED